MRATTTKRSSNCAKRWRWILAITTPTSTSARFSRKRLFRHASSETKPLPNREDRQLLCRAEAAQCLQGGRRLSGGVVAIDSSGVDFLSGFRRAALGDEDIHHCRHLWLSGGADFFLGV